MHLEPLHAHSLEVVSTPGDEHSGGIEDLRSDALHADRDGILIQEDGGALRGWTLNYGRGRHIDSVVTVLVQPTQYVRMLLPSIRFHSFMAVFDRRSPVNLKIQTHMYIYIYIRYGK